MIKQDDNPTGEARLGQRADDRIERFDARPRVALRGAGAGVARGRAA